MTHWQARISLAGLVLAVSSSGSAYWGLLFLLINDRTVARYIQVTVQGSGFHYSTMIPGVGPQSIYGCPPDG
jgi:hypothetical protein